MSAKTFFPLFVDISKKEILVIGGGNIALRRVKTLLEFTDRIHIVSPKVCNELFGLIRENHLDWRRITYDSAVITGADLVLAATSDRGCNEQIVEDCRAKGILVNASHQKELCDFYFPAIVKRDGIVAGITSSGVSHAMARKTRETVEAAIDALLEEPIDGQPEAAMDALPEEPEES